MQKNTMIIGISGPSASGKSLLANTIVNELGSDQVAVLHEDSYYKDLSDMPYAQRTNVNFDHPESLDHDLLHNQLIALQNGQTVKVPCYDFNKHIRSTKIRTVGQHRIIVIEGILLFFEKELRELMDIRIFMDTPLDVCLLRRLHRDIVERSRTLESVVQQYEKTVRPMYMQFIEPCKRYADIIIPRGGENRIAIDMIKAKIRELLSK